MSTRPRFLHVLCSLLLILSVSVLTFADTIRLKDGSIFKGKIVGFAGGKFTIAIGEGSRSRSMTFSAGEIDSIVFDSPSATPQTSSVNRNVSYQPPVAPPRVIVSDNSSKNIPQPEPKVSKKVANAKPIVLNTNVLADNTANGWTNSGWVVKKGQVIRISGSGKITLGNGRSTSASGLSDLEDANKLLKSVPTGALIAVVGDDNNDFIYVGSDREFTASRDGALFLGINEGNLDDNSGSFDVKIEIDPGN